MRSSRAANAGSRLEQSGTCVAYVLLILGLLTLIGKVVLHVLQERE